MLNRIQDIREATDGTSISTGLAQQVGVDFNDVLTRRQRRRAVDADMHNHAAEELVQRMHLDPTQVRNDADRLRDPAGSVLDFTRYMVEQHANGVRYGMAFVMAAAMQDQQNDRLRRWPQLLGDGKHPVCGLSLPGRTERMTIVRGSHRQQVDLPRNHYTLRNNMRDVYLHLLTGDGLMEYDQLHRDGYYLFTNRDEPSPFARELPLYVNGGSGREERLVQDKHILTIGAGYGADDEHLLRSGAASVTCLDGSAYIIGKLLERKRRLPEGLRDRFHVQDADDMFCILGNYADEGTTFDTVTAHSATHYFDDETFMALLKALRNVIKPNGHLAICTKAPGAVLDRDENCITLVRDVQPVSGTDNPDQVYVRKRGRMNFDDQTRWFRDADRMRYLLNQQFVVRRVASTDYEDYEAPGQGWQRFDYLICDMIPPSPPRLVDIRTDSNPPGDPLGGNVVEFNAGAGDLTGPHANFTPRPGLRRRTSGHPVDGVTGKARNVVK